MPFVIQHGDDGTFHGRRRLTQYQRDIPSRQKDLQKATVWKREVDAQYSMNPAIGDRIREVKLTLVGDAVSEREAALEKALRRLLTAQHALVKEARGVRPKEELQDVMREFEDAHHAADDLLGIARTPT